MLLRTGRVNTRTATTGEVRAVASVQAKFLRIKFVCSTGGASLTAKLMCEATARRSRSHRKESIP